MSVAVIKVDTRGNSELYCTFDPALVRRLKWSIPWPYRAWDKERKRWLVLEPFSDVLIGVVIEFYDIDLHDRRPPPPVPLDNTEQVFSALRKLVPAKRWPAWFKALARVAHPDAGGSDQLMQALNAVDSDQPRARR